MIFNPQHSTKPLSYKFMEYVEYIRERFPTLTERERMEMASKMMADSLKDTSKIPTKEKVLLREG